MKKELILSILFFSLCFISRAQNDTIEETYPTGTAPETSESEVLILTERNCPSLLNEPKLIQCRRLTEKRQIFRNQSKPLVTKTDKPYEKLTDLEKNYIIYLAWKTSDVTLLNKVLQIAKFDTSVNTQISSIKCLSRYNTIETKKVLIGYLSDTGAKGIVSALSLVQLGEDNLALNYIRQNYANATAHYYLTEINTALMNIGNTDAIRLLERIANDAAPSIALDAIGALSLLGKCDYAFQKFKAFAKYEHYIVRIDAANCLAFYIGTSEAMEIVKKMQYDKERVVSEEAMRIMKHFN